MTWHKPFRMELPVKRSRQTAGNCSYNQASINLRMVIMDEIFLNYRHKIKMLSEKHKNYEHKILRVDGN
jgi:hypothetical protein